MPGFCLENMLRTGIGQDSHKIKLNLSRPTKKPLVLGGVLVDKELGVEANSDGDVLIHALCNALNTAIGYGSLDLYAGPMYKKGIIDSKEYLKVALKMVKEKGYRINNVAFTVEAKKPRLEAHREKICDSLAKLLGVEKEKIGMAFTSGEKLTSFGKGEGIQAFCLVSLVK